MTCMFNMSLRSGLFQLLEGHVSREVKHGWFDTWEEVCRVLRIIVGDEPRVVVLALCGKVLVAGRGSRGGFYKKLREASPVFGRAHTSQL